MTSVQSIERSRVLRLGLITTLLMVAVAWNGGINAKSMIASARAASALPVAPFVTSSGAVDNGVAGNTFINCYAGGGLQPGEMVLLAVNTLSVGTTISPPAPGPGMPAWNIILFQADNGYTQEYYWHEVGTATVESSGPFQFSFTNGGGTVKVRAACVAAAYLNTCLMDSVSCTNPISASLSTSSTGPSDSISFPIFLSFPDNSLVIGAFGTSNTNSRFGDAAANPPGKSGTSGIDQGSGPIGSLNLSPINGVSGRNGGIMMTNLTEPFVGIDGPWTATLPQLGNFPTIKIRSITGNGTTVTATVADPSLLNQYQQSSFTATIGFIGVGGSPAGCFNGTFTVTPTPPAPSTTFTYPDPGCIGTGDASSATITIHDPGIGENIAQIVSIIPETQ